MGRLIGSESGIENIGCFLESEEVGLISDLANDTP